MEVILDFSRPLDVSILDAIVDVFNNPLSAQRSHAESVLLQFREHPESWTRVDTILGASTNAHTKFLALMILDDVVRFRWKALPRDQREGIRSYLVQKIVALSGSEDVMRAEHLVLSKLNIVLVQVLKQEWPTNWPDFIPEIVNASKTSEVLCENNMEILRLLSEEIFDFSKEQMTAAKAAALKESLKAEFSAIFDLILFVLEASSKPGLIVATLQCLQRYVTWIPEAYIFETPILEHVCMKFLPAPEFRVPSLQVVTEVAGLASPAYDKIFELLFMGVMGQIVKVVPPDVNIPSAWQMAEETGDVDSAVFLRHLALFLSTYFRVHGHILEGEDLRPFLLSGMNYLVGLSDVGDQEMMKICLEYWLRLANELYAAEMTYDPSLPALRLDGEGGGGAGGMSDGMSGASAVSEAPLSVAASTMVIDPTTGKPVSARKVLYSEVLARVREVLIRHMAKPEEVLIEKDEMGEFVREAQKDTDNLALYRVMRDTMVYLTHLDPQNMGTVMLEKLAKLMEQVTSPAAALAKSMGGSVATMSEEERQKAMESFNWDALNALCWAIGSISGTLTESAEKHFLVSVIKDLLVLCEHAKGKSNKAVVASNIMYVVGQYPRFLRAHWKFLRTVVVKLFEFMHEKHPGVQDMAVETFLKVATKCKKKFVQLQVGESIIFIEELCSTLPSIIGDLESHQVHTFYEAAGHMVAAHPDEEVAEGLTERLMALPNAVWGRLMRAAGDDIDSLRSVDTLRDIHRVLRTNTAACRSIGQIFARQLGRIYLDALNVYRAVSNFIGAAIASGGPNVMLRMEAKAMTMVKKEVLALVTTFISRAVDLPFIAEHFLPPLFEAIIPDYEAQAPAGRDAEVLNAVADIIIKMQTGGGGADFMTADTPKILSGLFAPTMGMISEDFHAFPEHRAGVYKLLEAVNTHCFPALCALGPDEQKMVVDAVIWAFRHEARDIGEVGLNILLGLLENIAAGGPAISQPFYAAYYIPIVHQLLGVLTDRLHRAHFKQHVALFRHLFYLVESGAITSPLWESPASVELGVTEAFQAKCNGAAVGGVVPAHLLTNQTFMREFIRDYVTDTFSNLSPAQVQSFIDGLFDTTRDMKAYKTLLRDFLIEVLEFGGADEGAELYTEERTEAAQEAAKAEGERRLAVPGLANPYDVLPEDYNPLDDEEL